MATSLILSAAALSGATLLTSRRARARERAAEAAYPPVGRLVPVSGGMVHAVTEGAGPDLVLIHGASGNLRDFTLDLIPRLARDWRVTAFDRPGLGWSSDMGQADRDPRAQAARLIEAASVLGLRAPVVLGHSYGGAVAMAWALAARGTALDAKALVILSGATMPWPGGLGTWYALTGNPVGQWLAVPAITAFASPARTEAAIAGIFAPDPVPPGYDAHFGAGLTLRRGALRVNARQVTGLRPHIVEMSALYPGLTLPVEILHGTADTIVPSAIHAEPLAATLPRARLTLMPGTGHMPHHARPEVLLAALSRIRATTGAG